METKSKEEAVYAFIVRGVVPELMRGMAFRREKHFKTAGKKILKCPYCGEEFETIDSTARIQLYCHTRKTKLVCDARIACRICRNVVGIIYASV